jgi:hypothetical protein
LFWSCRSVLFLLAKQTIESKMENRCFEIAVHEKRLSMKDAGRLRISGRFRMTELLASA